MGTIKGCEMVLFIDGKHSGSVSRDLSEDAVFRAGNLNLELVAELYETLLRQANPEESQNWIIYHHFCQDLPDSEPEHSYSDPIDIAGGVGRLYGKEKKTNVVRIWINEDRLPNFIKENFGDAPHWLLMPLVERWGKAYFYLPQTLDCDFVAREIVEGVFWGSKRYGARLVSCREGDRPHLYIFFRQGKKD
jgi:hypothetical protein